MFHCSYLQIFKPVKLGKTSIRQKSNLVILQESEAKRRRITSVVFFMTGSKVVNLMVNNLLLFPPLGVNKRERTEFIAVQFLNISALNH